MATIALVTQSTSHAAYTTTKTGLESKGHTVNGFAQSAVTSSNLLGHDLIILCRIQSTDSSHAALAGFLRTYLDTHEIPILIGFNSASATNSDTAGMVTLLSMAAKASIQSGRGPRIYASDAHPVWSLVGVTPPASVSVLSSSDYSGRISPIDPYVGGVVGTASSSDASPTILLAEKGSLDLAGNQFGARIGYVGWIYGAAGYSPLGLSVLDSLVSWATSQPAYLQGTVQDHLGNKLGRVVRAYNRTSGRLVGVVNSDPTTGEFKIFVPDANGIYYAVALDEFSGTKNALIKDRIAPYLE